MVKAQENSTTKRHPPAYNVENNVGENLLLEEDVYIPPTQLFPTRKEVAVKNHECLAALGGESVRSSVLLLHE